MNRGNQEHRGQYGRYYKSQYEALIAIQDFYAEGEIDATDRPMVEYVGGTKPYMITILVG